MDRRIIINDVTGKYCDVVSIPLQGREPFQVSDRYKGCNLYVIEGVEVEHRGYPMSNVVKVLVYAFPSSDQSVLTSRMIVKNTGVMDNLREAWSMIREIRFFRKLNRKFADLFVELEDIMFPLSVDELYSKITDTYKVYKGNQTMVNLSEFIQAWSNTPQYYEYCRFILAQLVLVVLYLDSNGMEHRNLVPSNVLITPQLHSSGLLAPKLQITGLGSLGYHEDSSTTTGENLINSVVLKDERSGSKKCMPPEKLLGISNSHCIDMWSVGLLFAHLLHKKEPDQLVYYQRNGHYLEAIHSLIGDPYPNDLEFIEVGTDNKLAADYKKFLLQRFSSGSITPSSLIQLLSVECKDALALDMVTRLLTFNPAQRILPLEAIHHPYLQDFIFSDPILNELFNVEELVSEAEIGSNRLEHLKIGKHHYANEDDISPEDSEMVRKTLVLEKFLFFNPKLKV